MAKIELSRDGDVFVLTFNRPAQGNAIDGDMLDELMTALDTVEDEPGNAALLLVSRDPKNWSVGLDLEYIQANGGYGFLFREFAPRVDAMLARLALLRRPTVAAISGHAYGGGALIASACDFRLMRADRGRFCFPEVDLKLAFTPTMLATVQLLPAPAAAWELAMTGRAVGGEEAAAMGIVSSAHSEETLEPKAMELARSLASKDAQTYATIKLDWRVKFAQATTAADSAVPLAATSITSAR